MPDIQGHENKGSWSEYTCRSKRHEVYRVTAFVTNVQREKNSRKLTDAFINRAHTACKCVQLVLLLMINVKLTILKIAVLYAILCKFLSFLCSSLFTLLGSMCTIYNSL